MKAIFIFLFSLHVFLLYGKEKPKPFIQRILSHKGPLLIYNFQPSVNDLPVLNIKDLPATFQFSGQGLTKNNKGLFLHQIGTGRMYRWEGDAQLGEWERIDSTYFTGYNFLSLFFSVDSSVYSFGGLGFWQANGHLRKYNFAANEWNAKELNKSVPWVREAHEIFFIDTTKKLLYFNGEGRRHDELLATDKVDSSSLGMIYCLDLEKGMINKLGKYETGLVDFFGQTPWGTIAGFNKLADFSNNEYYTLSETVENNLLRILTKSTSNHFKWQFSFWMDSALYFSNSDFGYDSVIIRKSDLIKMNKPIFIPVKDSTFKNNNSSIQWIWIIAFIALVASNIYFFNKYKQITKKQQRSEKQSSEGFAKNHKIKFTEIEYSLIQLLLENSILKKMTQINEINNILGCTNKNIDIQKRLRSDAINTLNEKLSLLLLTENKIIERKRSEFDGRTFEYFIEPSYFSEVQQILNTQAFS
jgi:hypothetical protein